MLLVLTGCGSSPPEPVSRVGIKAVEPTIKAGTDGLTTEQRNVKARIEMDNKPGVIKHLYVLSAYSGQAILYSTVTSSGKRLSPYSVVHNYQANNGGSHGEAVYVGGRLHYTNEVLQDDGTYGSSAEYIYCERRLSPALYLWRADCSCGHGAYAHQECDH